MTQDTANGRVVRSLVPLDGKRIWITGGGRGVGRALALAFAAAGAELLLSGRSVDALETTAQGLRRTGAVAHVAPGSVTKAKDVEAAVGIASDVWGGLDVLINNAGISPSFVRSEKADIDEVRDILDVNLVGALRCCQAALPLMEAGGGGSIVNVSSIHGAVGHERLAAYAMSKGGLEMLTRTLALEWAPKRVRVNALAPGFITTDMTTGLRESEHWNSEFLRRIPMGRYAEPEEMVAAAGFLASDASSYVTGSTLTADGGWCAQ